jgi:peptidoglycan/LPS O-acetylase OafA/YrhL
MDTPHTTTTPRRVPALDGMRGLALAGVLAYHCGFGWARGGFLGVSLFFTLSGFLITSLLLESRALGAFWSRRARRLLPAALLALAGIVLFGATVAGPSQLRDLRVDVLAALGYVANWRFILHGTTYASLWSSPSPVQHFWSLAIEEQLYLALPLLLVATRGRRRTTAAALGAALAGSLLATAIVHTDQLRAYYGTDVRAAELVIGALLAVAVAGRPQLGRGRRGVDAGAAGALVLLLLAWATTSQTDGRLYTGGLVVHALAVALVIVAARDERTVTARALSLSPLRWLGRRSYAAYLYHWPIFLWLTPSRTGLDGVALAAMRVAVSLVLADVSTRLFEEPIRTGRRLRRPVVLVAYPVTALVLVVAVIVTTTSIDAPATYAFANEHRAELQSPATVLASSTSHLRLAPVRTAAPITLAPGERLRVYVAGDSNAYILGGAMIDWGKSHGVDVWASGWFGCAVVTGGQFRYAGRAEPTTKKCDSWPEVRAREIAELRPHIVIVVHGSFDVLDRRLAGSDQWQHVGMPAYDTVAKDAIARMVDLFLDGGARVLWAAYPHVRTGVVDGQLPAHDHPESDPSRMDRFNTLARQVVAARPGAQMLELERQLQAWPGGELDRTRRLDGLHPDPDQVPALAAWMGEQALALVQHP